MCDAWYCEWGKWKSLVMGTEVIQQNNVQQMRLFATADQLTLLYDIPARNLKGHDCVLHKGRRFQAARIDIWRQVAYLTYVPDGQSAQPQLFSTLIRYAIRLSNKREEKRMYSTVLDNTPNSGLCVLETFFPQWKHMHHVQHKVTTSTSRDVCVVLTIPECKDDHKQHSPKSFQFPDTKLKYHTLVWYVKSNLVERVPMGTEATFFTHAPQGAQIKSIAHRQGADEPVHDLVQIVAVAGAW
jgi:hypothetical protein